MKTKRVASVGLASLVIGGLAVVEAAGCNLIVGSGDYSVGAQDATFDTSQPQPDTGPGVDTSSPGVDTGPGLDAGQDTNVPPTDSPSGDDSSVDVNANETGAPCGSTLPPTSNTDFAQLIKGCVLHFACSSNADNPTGATPSFSIGTCIAEDDLGLFGATSCEKSAQNCADIVSCSGYGYATNAQCDGGTSVHCDTATNTAYQCDPTNNAELYPGQTIDCAKQGGTCTVYTDVDGGATTPSVDCKVVPSCSLPDNSTACTDAGVYYSCINGVGYGSQCSNFQTHCDPSSPGCYYNTASCDAGGTPVCNGATKQYCTPDGVQYQIFHCEHAGLTCVPGVDEAGAPQGNCVAPGCGSCTESCSGSTLNACVGGAPLAIDCSQYSGMTCRTVTVLDVNGNPVSVPHCLP